MPPFVFTIQESDSRVKCVLTSHSVKGLIMPKSVYKDNFPNMAKGVRQAIEDRYIEEKTMRGKAGGGRGFKNPMTVPEINTKRQYEAERKAGDPNALRLSFEEWKQL
jgi:hypothetical protein